MKLPAVLLLLLVTTAARSQDQVGRFILHNANYQTTSSTASINVQTVIKIDTVTGKTWALRSFVLEGKHREGWEEVESLYKPSELEDSLPIRLLRVAQVVEWCKAHPTGATKKDGELVRTWSAEQIANILTKSTAEFDALSKQMAEERANPTPTTKPFEINEAFKTQPRKPVDFTKP